MSKVNRFALAVKRGKQSAKARAAKADAPLAASIRVPLYLAAIGLLVVYGWGAVNSFPVAMAGALCAVFAMSELLKPKLGELAADALAANDKVGTVLMLIASAACVALGVLGGVIALGAANSPRESYEIAVAGLGAAQGRLDEAQAQLDALPTCTPDMPRIRCIEQTEQNSATRMDRTMTRDQAKQERDGAKAALDRLPAPGPGVPHVPLWMKAGVIGAVEFVLFAVPFATRRRMALEAPRAEMPHERGAEAKTKDAPPSGKINDGGWERRRQLYGPSGRKPRGGLRLVAVQA